MGVTEQMDTKIKQRLIGTGVLIALAVIFIPMLFESARVPQTQPASFESDIATPAPAVDYNNQAMSETNQSDAQTTNNSTAATAQDLTTANNDNTTAETSNTITATTDAKPATSMQQATQGAVEQRSENLAIAQNDIEQATSLATLEKAANQSGKAWAIQLASFENEKRAQTLVSTLKQQGFSAFTNTTKIGNQVRVRVYVGPESDQQQAKLTLAKLQETLHMQGFVVSIKPDALAQPQTT
jgi:DedD protein